MAVPATGTTDQSVCVSPCACRRLPCISANTGGRDQADSRGSAALALAAAVVVQEDELGRQRGRPGRSQRCLHWTRDGGQAEARRLPATAGGGRGGQHSDKRRIPHTCLSPLGTLVGACARASASVAAFRVTGICGPWEPVRLGEQSWTPTLSRTPWAHLGAPPRAPPRPRRPSVSRRCQSGAPGRWPSRRPRPAAPGGCLPRPSAACRRGVSGSTGWLSLRKADSPMEGGYRDLSAG